MTEDWRKDLETWLTPFLTALRHKTRMRVCPAYIAGLIGPGDRKSVQPMAARGGEFGYDRLHHFVADGVWDSAPLEAVLLKEADRLVGDEAGYLVIDDTALPKKGCHSVGVAPQYASSLGKTANCQSLVSVTLASREVPMMVGLRLFLPESWTDNAGRMTRARVPLDRQQALTKPEIAIEEIDRVIASGARFGCVLADAGYGSSGPFRQALSARGLLWAVGLSRRQTVYPADVELIFPVAKTGKRRKYHIPDKPAISAEAMLSGERWRKISTVCRAVACNACPVMRSGLSASADRPESKNITCQTCPPMPRSKCSLPRSRLDGSANKRTSSSRKSSASTTSKADPGPDYTDMP
jgi:SRSO17 transposase